MYFCSQKLYQLYLQHQSRIKRAESYCAVAVQGDLPCRQKSSTLTMIVPSDLLPKDDKKLQKQLYLQILGCICLLLARILWTLGKILMKIGDAAGLCFSLPLCKEKCMFCSISCHIACFSSPFVFAAIQTVQLLPAQLQNALFHMVLERNFKDYRYSLSQFTVMEINLQFSVFMDLQTSPSLSSEGE